MGDYDAVAQIEYALKHSGTEKVAYIGHSQGTTQMFYGLSDKPEYWESKMNLFVALAPVTQLSHTTCDLFKYLAWSAKYVVDVFDALHIYSILGPVSSAATEAVCSVLPDLCKLIEGFVITHDPKYDNSDRFQVYMGHYPAGASLKSVQHYA